MDLVSGIDKYQTGILSTTFDWLDDCLLVRFVKTNVLRCQNVTYSYCLNYSLQNLVAWDRHQNAGLHTQYGLVVSRPVSEIQLKLSGNLVALNFRTISIESRTRDESCVFRDGSGETVMADIPQDTRPGHQQLEAMTAQASCVVNETADQCRMRPRVRDKANAIILSILYNQSALLRTTHSLPKKTRYASC